MTVLRLDAIDEGRLREALAGSAEVVVEGADPLPALGGEDENRLWLRLRAASVYRSDLAHPLAGALGARLGLGAERVERIELALQEALANAVVHGSLEMQSNGRESIEAFLAYCETIEGRLDDPAHGHRVIDVIARWTAERVTIEVIDSGPGYAPGAVGGGDGAKRKSGRGLAIIGDLADGMTVGDGGRRLTMSFVR